MKLGLSESHLGILIGALQSLPPICKAIVFGSRAMGTNSPVSDIDLAIFGDEVSFTVVVDLVTLLEESDLPLKVDVVNYANITNAALREHIDRVGKLIYERVQ
jgi:uncharacterized protein